MMIFAEFGFIAQERRMLSYRLRSSHLLKDWVGSALEGSTAQSGAPDQARRSSGSDQQRLGRL